MRIVTVICLCVFHNATLVAKASDATISSRETLDHYRDELRTITADIPAQWRVQFTKPQSVPASTIQSLRKLSDDLIRFIGHLPTGQSSSNELFKRWATVYQEVFTLRVILEWQNLEPSWAEFIKIEEKIVHLSGEIRHDHLVRAFAGFASPILRLWIVSHFHDLQPWINRFETNWLANDQGELPSWWLKERCDYAFGLVGRDSSPEARKIGENWLLTYFADSSVRLERRSSLLSRYVLQQHTLGEPEAAMRMLRWWENQHPDEAMNDVRILHINFFVHQIGHADRESARRILNHFDRLVASGSLSIEDDRYRVVTQNYYRNLRHTHLDHALLTSQMLKIRKPEEHTEP